MGRLIGRKGKWQKRGRWAGFVGKAIDQQHHMHAIFDDAAVGLYFEHDFPEEKLLLICSVQKIPMFNHHNERDTSRLNAMVTRHITSNPVNQLQSSYREKEDHW